MTKDELKDLHKLLALKKVLDDRFNTLKAEIAKIENKIASAASVEYYNRLLTLKSARIKNAEILLCEVESRALEIERALNDVWQSFTPLEALVMQKIYVEGLDWSEFERYVYSTDELITFRYERSTYMNAHRRALDKLGIPKTGRGGRPRVQKTKGD